MKSTITTGYTHHFRVDDGIEMGGKRFVVTAVTNTAFTVRPFRWYDRLAIWRARFNRWTYMSDWGYLFVGGIFGMICVEIQYVVTLLTEAMK